jgi:hypothetical protein
VANATKEGAAMAEVWAERRPTLAQTVMSVEVALSAHHFQPARWNVHKSPPVRLEVRGHLDAGLTVAGR